jgi:hypothetical protein
MKEVAVNAAGFTKLMADILKSPHQKVPQRLSDSSWLFLCHFVFNTALRSLVTFAGVCFFWDGGDNAI